MSVATQLVLEGLGEDFEIEHLDTADRRGIQGIGKLDFTNVYLALAQGLKYLRVLRRFRPDLIYVPISQSLLPFLRDCLFLLPARLLDEKVIVHLHGSDFRRFYDTQPGWAKSLVRFALGRAGKTIVLGTRLTSLFKGISPDTSVCVVPNGIPDFAGVPQRDGQAIPLTVLFLSTLMKEKGLFDLLKAVPLILRKRQDCRFVFAGEWLREAEQRIAETMVQEWGIQAFVEFRGPVGPAVKSELFRSAYVFVLPSYHEGQPFAILEALCSSLPVIATDVGCITDSVVNGRNGFIVKQASPESIAEAILLLLADPELARMMGKASREVFVSQHRSELFVSRLADVWSSAVSAN